MRQPSKCLLRRFCSRRRNTPLPFVAYCFMPDHLHVLAEGLATSADMVAFASDLKQRVAYYHPEKCSTRIWQKGFYDRVLRNDEATLTVAKYILENPVR